MKKNICTVLSMCLMLTLFSGCVPSSGGGQAPAGNSTGQNEGGGTSENGGENTTPVSGTPLKVGLMPSAVGAPVQYALEQGYFEEEGVNIQTVIFPSGAPINEAVAAKELDVAMSGAATVFSLASGNVKLLGDIAGSGGMGIWVRADSDIMNAQGEAADAKDMYGSAETIKGKTFICALGTASQFNVLRYISQYGLTDADVNIVHMEFGAGAQAFNAGEGDAIATFAPYSAQVEAEGAVKCCTFEDATQTALYDMMFARNEIIENRRDDLVKYVRAVERAIEDLSDHDTRTEFSMRWFADEGREYDEATMEQEIADRPYVNKALMTVGSYVFGDAMIGYGEFNVEIGKIEPEGIENIKNCFDDTILEEAVGITVKDPVSST